MNKNLLSVLLVIFSVTINAIAFFWWLSLIKIDGGSPEKVISQYVLDYVALQISILETVMAVAGVALAIVAFFGYQNIKNSAVKQAVEAAKEQAQKITQEYIKSIENAERSTKERRVTLAEEGKLENLVNENDITSQDKNT